MTVNPGEFWRSNHYNHPALTDKMVADAELQLGVKLPDEYIALLYIQNGGYTHRFGFPTSHRTLWAEDHVPLHELFGIVTDPSHRTAQNILDTAYMTREWDLPPRQVLLAGNGHWWITLDYRNGEVSSVAWLAIDSGQDFQLAPSFGAFLNGLLPLSAFDESVGH